MSLLSQKTGLPSFSSADSPIVNYFTDSGFERGTNGVIPTGWAQYNDGAVAVPVDGTGGAAVSQVTMLVSNSSPIRGSFSAIISKDAANRQGVGYSFLFTISQADKGRTAGVSFDMQTSTNYAAGDVVFYIYDVTNSILITPRAVSLPKLDNFGQFITDYGLQTGTQYRFILHIATTNASAWTLKLDTMVNSTTMNGAASSSAYIYETTNSFTITATTSNPTAGVGSTYYRETIYNGDGTATIYFEFSQIASGSAGSGDYLFPLPTGLTIDYSRTNASGTNPNNGSLGVGIIAINASQFNFQSYAYNTGAYVNKIAFAYNNDTTPMTAWGSAGGSLASAAIRLSIRIRVPITQWGTGGNIVGPALSTQWGSDDGTSDVLGPQGSLVPNQAFATSSTTRVFSFSVPQDLRQFVSLEINNRTFGWGPNPYPFVGGNNANANNFYGVRGYWTSATQFTVEFGNQGTRVSASNADNGASSWATEFTNGTRFRVGLSIGGVFIGINLVNATQSGFARAYNDLAKIRLQTGNGYGSTNLVIRRFTTTVINTGSGITYADSSTLGASFTCTEAGIYCFSYNDVFSASSNFGLSINSSQLSTGIASITTADRLIMATAPAASQATEVSVTIALSVGDVVRPHGDATTESAVPSRVTFVVQRVA